MSDLPGEITKQILSAPPRIRRSTRYSETAHGRSIPCSVRLPTGSSSFENASGCIRLPRPAAGIIPHISGLRRRERAALRLPRSFKQLNQLVGTPPRAVLLERPLPGAARHRLQLPIAQLKRCDHIGGSAGQNDFLTGLEECIEPVPDIAEDRRTACGRLEQASGRTPAPFHHRPPGHVKSKARGAKKGRVLGRWQVADEIDVGRPREVLWVLRAANQKPSRRQ